MNIKKPRDEERLDSIEESLAKISCSMSGIWGILDTFLKEFMEEKAALQSKEPNKKPSGPFFHEDD